MRRLKMRHFIWIYTVCHLVLDFTKVYLLATNDVPKCRERRIFFFVFFFFSETGLKGLVAINVSNFIGEVDTVHKTFFSRITLKCEVVVVVFVMFMQHLCSMYWKAKMNFLIISHFPLLLQVSLTCKYVNPQVIYRFSSSITSLAHGTFVDYIKRWKARNIVDDNWVAFVDRGERSVDVANQYTA